MAVVSVRYCPAIQCEYYSWKLTILGSPREFLENYIFPLLLPALDDMLVEAKKNKVFEVRFSLQLKY